MTSLLLIVLLLSSVALSSAQTQTPTVSCPSSPQTISGSAISINQPTTTNFPAGATLVYIYRNNVQNGQVLYFTPQGPATHTFDVPSTVTQIQLIVQAQDGTTVTTANCLFNVQISSGDPCNANPCANNGQCSRVGTSSIFVCTCTGAWQGTTCTVPVTTPCSSNPCRNGGTCSSTGNRYICTCPNGFIGAQCETPTGSTGGIVLDPCVSNPCQNGAACIAISSITFRCNCLSGFVGLTCDTRDFQASSCSPNPCFNGGVCSVNGQGYTCECGGTDGFAGDRCEYRPDELCDPGSEGDLTCGTRTCLKRIPPDNMPNEATFVCVCVDSFQMGHDCSVGADSRFIETCYGSACKRLVDELGQSANYFETPDYPSLYDNRQILLYLLYLPGVAEICFSFDQTAFGIENDKDELYVGAGLQFDYEDLLAQNSPEGVFFFEDRSSVGTTPADFCIPSDTAWVYWVTDKTIREQGWRMYWSVESDSTPPIVICPDNIVENVVFGQGGRDVSWTAPEASDNSGIAPTLVYSSHDPNSFFQSGQTTVTYVYRDGAENEGSCTFSVDIREVDSTPPVISGGPGIGGITETIACNVGRAIVTWTEPTATDNSGTATLADRSHVSGQFFQTGTTSVTYTFVDPSGNQASTSFDVRVNEVDSEPPTCQPAPPNDVRREIPLNQGSTSVSFTQPMAVDVCGPTTLVGSSHQSGDTFNTGTTTVTYIYEDSSGNRVTCAFNVIVDEVDSEPPLLTGPDDMTFQIPLNAMGRTVTFTEPSATDNSGVVRLVQRSHTSGQRFNTGTTTVTYVFEDESGNRATHTFDVIIVEVDETPPDVTGPGRVTESTPLGTGGRVVNFPEPTATDNSGSVTLVSRTHTPNQYFQTGTTRVVYVFRDSSGNEATYEFDVVVVEVDRTPPDVTGPGGVSESTPLGTGGRQVNFPEPTATDNSGSVTLVSRTHTPNQFFPVGTTTVVYVFRDPSGNEATYEFDVEVVEVDDTPPVINAPTIGTSITAIAMCNTGGTTVSWTEPTATDNSGVVNLASRSHEPGRFFMIGTTTVSYVFVDPSENFATYVFDVIVNEVDSVPPTCQPQPNDITRTIPLNQGSTSIAFPQPRATDDCGPTTLIGSSHQPGATFDTGTTQVTYEYEDNSGNSVICAFNVIVDEVDRTPPDVTGPGGVSESTRLGTGGRQVNFPEPTATDNSGSVTLVSRTHTPNQFFPVGTTTVVYVFRDPSGNEATYEFDVEVVEVDDTPPVINAPTIGTSITAIAMCNTGGTTVSWTEPTATDNSGVVNLASRSHEPGRFFLIGTTTVSYVFVDPSENFATYVFDVIVNEVDSVPPTCQPQPNDITRTIPLNQGSTSIAFPQPRATDDCGPTTLVGSSHQPGATFDTGTTQVTYEYEDNSGNSVICAFNVIVDEVDRTPPSVTGSGDRTVTIPLNQGGSSVTWPEPTATDNSGSVTLVERSHIPGQRFDTGTTTVRYVFQDPSGNRVVYEFDVNVVEVDGTPPVINAPSIGNSISATARCNTGGTTVSWTEPTATDNSGIVNLASKSHEPGRFFPTGTTTVTYRFADLSGNSATYSFDVIVQEVDNAPPTCQPQPEDITQNIPLNQGSTTISFPQPRAVDDCGPTTLVGSSHQSGDTFNEGTTTVTYIYEDNSGNRVICAFNVIVDEVDRTPPTVSGSGDRRVTIPLNQGGTTVTWTEPTASDNSGSVTLVSRSHTPGQRFDTGTTTVTYIFRDPSGNRVTYEFDVIVDEVDRTPPTVSGSGDRRITIPLNQGGTSVTWIEPTANDNSGSVTLVSRSHTPGQRFDTGTTTVTYIFRDPSGNRVTYEFDVIVDEVDNTPPVINAPSIGTTISATAMCNTGGTTVSWTEPTATDNSGVVNLASRSHEPGRFFTIGTTTVTYRFDDLSGNSATYSFDVEVQEVDNVPPTCQPQPNDITRNIRLNQGSTSVSFPQPRAVDDCGPTTLVSSSHQPGATFNEGTTRVTYVFEDGSRNRVICAFNVIVNEVDTEPPTIMGSGDRSVTIPLNQGSTTVTWTEPTVMDNSGIFTLVERSHAPGSRFNTGTTTVTYVYVDQSGNRATYDFDVIVVEVDDIPPVIESSIGPGISVEIACNLRGTSVTWTEPTATDNSGVVSLVARTASPGQFFTTGTTPVTYRFQDGTGNEASLTFDITVTEVDRDNPTCSQLNDVELTIPLGTGGTTATWTEPMATDACGPTTLDSRNYQPGNFFNTGTTRVSYIFSDQSGNFVNCAFNIQVTEVDTRPPDISGPDDMTVTIPLNQGGTNVNFVPPTATDNSGTVTLVSSSHNPGDYFQTGTTTVTYIFRDPTGNTSPYSFDVVVQEVDTVPPEIRGSGDITETTQLGTGGRSVTWPELTANDNSGSATLVSSSHTNGQFFPTGTTVVTYTFTDPSGNVATYNFNVNVIEVDDIPPTVTCPANVQLTTLPGMGGMNMEWEEASATDNSGRANLIERSHIPGSFFSVGETPVTYMFEDPSGNRGSCSFTVSISEANPCLPQPCLNGGTCVIESPTTYTCLCTECYSGNECQTGAEPCGNHNCANGGACVPFTNSCDQYYCECPDCFSGRYCTERADPCANNQCQNGAICTPDPTDCSRYMCACPTCYSGQFCENAYDACTNHQCTNGAQCIPVPNGGCTEYTCSCSGCFTGLFCQENRDPCALNPCLNGGNCRQVQGSCFSYQCECGGCFSGYNCEIAIPNPCTNNPCQNGGVCNVVTGQCFAYSCRCPSGFTGINCGQTVTQNTNPCTSFPCLNGGSCLTMDANNYYICICPADYLGINCQTRRSVQINFDACASSPCSNGDCYNSYNSISSSNNNFVRQYTCVCDNGFTGSNCALRTSTIRELDICNIGTRPPCRNGGVCFNDYHSFDQDVDYFCQCRDGFIGHNCEVSYVNPCSSSPCLNGAQCNDFTTFFFCQCPPGYTGTLCQTDAIPDNQPPIILDCPSSQSVFSPVGGAQVTWDEPTATDNRDTNPPLSRQSHTPNSFFPLGRTTVTYVFTDDANNAASCTFFVTVFSINNDVTPPEITGCPTMNIVVTVPSSTSGATATWTEPTAIDNSGSNPSRTSTHFPDTRFPVGTTRVTYTFTDASRNAAVCAFNVVVNSGPDNTPPVISNCPSVVTQDPDPIEPYTLIEWTMPTATDDSGTVTLTYASVQEPRVLFQHGSQPVTITYVFSDSSGNSASCTFQAQTISGTGDRIPPVIQNCPSSVDVEVVATATSGVGVWQIPTATDNSGATPTRTQTHNPGSIFPLGSTTVTYTFTDGSGNLARCSFNVMVFMMTGDDTTPPTITTCPNDIIADVPAGLFFQMMTWTIPTATDDSGMATLASGTPFGTDLTSAFFQVGQQYFTTLIYTFTDPSGNEATCEFRIGALVNAPNPCFASPCQNGGQCSQITNSYQCTCSAGYEGNKCQNLISNTNGCLSGPCLNGGQCTAVGSNGYQCTCVSGYSGNRCQTPPNTNGCLSGPCLNGGQCTAVGSNGYQCTCVSGYSGNRCQTPPLNPCSSGPCFNGGQCRTLGNGYQCTCFSGYAGSRCQITPSDDVCLPSPCLNGGTCIPFAMGTNYFCLCVDGYTGSRCQQATGQPTVTCSPSTVPTSSSESISYTPTLTNFANTGNVQMTYTYTNQQANLVDAFAASLPISSTPHSFNLPPGSNTVTVTSTSGVQTATCTFQYFRTDIQCPSSSTASSGTLQFPRPTITFPDNNQVAFIRYSAVAGQVITQSNALPQHTLTGFTSGTTTTLTATAQDTSGNSATCTFDYTYPSAPSNPCDSSPCSGGLLCFYFMDNYVCSPPDSGRRRRDGDDLLDNLPCVNGGRRVDDVDGSRCICQPGYTGMFCLEVEEPELVDICQWSPCAHNGTCIDLQKGGQPGEYLCLCTPGWTGTDCQQSESETQLEPIPKDFLLNAMGMVVITLIMILFVIAAVGICYLRIRVQNVRNLVKKAKHVDEMPIVH